MKIPADRTIFDEPHFQSLELLAVQALAARDFLSAFKYADRRCRILPVPDPHCYILRAKALFNLNAKAEAIDDLVRALEIAPDDIAANRAMLNWGRGSALPKAAAALIKHDSDADYLRRAIAILRQHGHRDLAHTKILKESVVGWAVWTGEAALDVHICDGKKTTEGAFTADASHPLAAFGNAASFQIRRPISAEAQVIQLSTAGRIFHETRAPTNGAKIYAVESSPRPVHRRKAPVTVVVPVYGDFEATRLCLETLLEDLKQSHHRALVVNDATPDQRISRYVAGLTRAAGVDVLVNARNRGFVGSVNRALTSIDDGDVIILNSDTVLPRGFIDRLAATAHSSDDIATVTPLSNNGEFTSFPLPFAFNLLPARKEIERLDKIAATVNAGKVIDIPSGIGFCLYVTRACLDKVGVLSEDFDPGYLEDVDFCLRAHNSGLRNVCDPSVYVGHAGSKSFKNAKRSLVVRNLAVLEQRFPWHRRDCGTFMAADPLRTARQAIELKATKDGSWHLLVSGGGAMAAIARKRARDLAPADGAVMMLEVRQEIVALREANSAIPQSIEFDLQRPQECASLIRYLKSIKPKRTEFLDPAGTPIVLANLLLTLGVPYDLFIADAGLLGSPDAQAVVAAASPQRRHGDAHCRPSPRQTQHDARSWRTIAEGAQQILVPCAEASDFIATSFPHLAIRKAEGSESKRGRVKAPSAANASQLGLVPLRGCVQEQQLMREVGRELGRIQPNIAITVVGASLDDIDLMRTTQMFVTGAVASEEFKRTCALLGLSHLFLVASRPLFAHPMLSAARSSSLPLAYFDWSSRRIATNKKDLLIDPSASLSEVAATLGQWMGPFRRSRTIRYDDKRSLHSQ